MPSIRALQKGAARRLFALGFTRGVSSSSAAAASAPLRIWAAVVLSYLFDDFDPLCPQKDFYALATVACCLLMLLAARLDN